jgi:hypothetical protein
MPDRPQKITFAEMRESGIRGLLIYCADLERAAPDCLHCPLFWRSAIVIWQSESQTCPAPPTFPLVHLSIHLPMSQLTPAASPGRGATAIDSP